MHPGTDDKTYANSTVEQAQKILNESLELEKEILKIVEQKI